MGSCEHDSCTEVLEAGGKIAFESREDIRCRHQQEDCSTVTNTLVVQMTARLLKEKEDFPMRKEPAKAKSSLCLIHCLFSFLALSLIHL